MNITKIKNDFTFLKNNPHVSYLDSGATSLTPDIVVNKMNEYYFEYPGSVHRGAYQISYEATKQFEKVRTKAQKFINAESESEIIFTKGTTTSLNFLAKAFEHLIKPGDEIITTNLEHHANFLPWQELAKKCSAKLIIVEAKDLKITEQDIIDHININTKIIAISHTTNVIGNYLNSALIAPFKKDAFLVVDAAQAAAHQKIDVQEMQADFLVFSGHKMLGPTGVGVLYGKKASLNTLKPFEYGGAMVDTVDFVDSFYKDAPEKYEAGTPNAAEVIGLGEAINYLEAQNLSEIHNHEVKLKKLFLKKVANISELIIYNADFDNGIITFNIKDVHPHDTASFLAEDNICVRAGHHCNQLTMKALKINATVRATIYLYNDENDIDQLVQSIKKVINFFHN